MAHDIRIVTEAKLRAVVKLDLASVDVIEQAFAALASDTVAAQHLAPRDVTTAGVIGTGVQARLQMQAAHLVHTFQRALVHGRDPAEAAACASDLAETLGIEADVADAKTLVERSRLVVTTTSARAPVLMADWLHPGLHITAMGSDQAGKNEIDPRALAAADLYIADLTGTGAQDTAIASHAFATMGDAGTVIST